MRDWEVVADNLKKRGWSWGYVSAVDSNGRTIWIADAHRGDGRCFIVRSDEKLTAFNQLRTIFSLSSPMAKLQNCDGVLNDLSRNADRPAVFTLRKRGSETWSYADL